MSTETWSPETFTERLRAVGGAQYHDKHPFHQRMHDGSLSRRQIQGWVANRFYYQKSIPVKDAAILSKLPTREMRREWIQRIVDHDGAREGEGGIEKWLRLAEATGLTREEVLDERHVVPGVRFAVDAYINFARTKPWIEAVASSLTELFAPDLVSYRMKVLEDRYPWVDRDGLQYFSARLTQAPRDAEYALKLVIEHCRTLEAQQRAVAALKFKCDVLWSQLDATAVAYPDDADA